MLSFLASLIRIRWFKTGDCLSSSLPALRHPHSPSATGDARAGFQRPPPATSPFLLRCFLRAFRRPGVLSYGVWSLTHLNEEKTSSRNKYIFNEPFSGRLHYFSSHTKCINPLPSVVVPYYKCKNILRAPSPTIPGKSLICSQKMRV